MKALEEGDYRREESKAMLRINELGLRCNLGQFCEQKGRIAKSNAMGTETMFRADPFARLDAVW